jgi:hypothetical protein
MEKISWTDRVKNEVLREIKRQRTSYTRKANWIGYISRMECLLKHVIKENIEVKGRRGIRGKQLPDDLKERKDTGHCKRKHHFTPSGKFVLEQFIGL